MTAIKTQKEYEAMLARIEELLPLTWGDNIPEDSPENIELGLSLTSWRITRIYTIR